MPPANPDGRPLLALLPTHLTNKICGLGAQRLPLVLAPPSDPPTLAELQLARAVQAEPLFFNNAIRWPAEVPLKLIEALACSPQWQFVRDLSSLWITALPGYQRPTCWPALPLPVPQAKRSKAPRLPSSWKPHQRFFSHHRLVAATAWASLLPPSWRPYAQLAVPSASTTSPLPPVCKLVITLPSTAHANYPLALPLDDAHELSITSTDFTVRSGYKLLLAATYQRPPVEEQWQTAAGITIFSGLDSTSQRQRWNTTWRSLANLKLARYLKEGAFRLLHGCLDTAGGASNTPPTTCCFCGASWPSAAGRHRRSHHLLSSCAVLHAFLTWCWTAVLQRLAPALPYPPPDTWLLGFAATDAGPPPLRSRLEITRVLAWQTCWRLLDAACSTSPISTTTAHQFLHRAQPLLRAFLLRHLHDRLEVTAADDASSLAQQWASVATLHSDRTWTASF